MRNGIHNVLRPKRYFFIIVLGIISKQNNKMLLQITYASMNILEKKSQHVETIGNNEMGNGQGVPSSLPSQYETIILLLQTTTLKIIRTLIMFQVLQCMSFFFSKSKLSMLERMASVPRSIKNKIKQKLCFFTCITPPMI